MNATEEITRLRGATLIGADGGKIGSIQDIYADRETGRPEWMAVSTGMFGSRLSFVPLAEAQITGDDVRVPYDKAQVKDAPNVEPDGELSQQEETELYRYYGIEYATSSVDDSGTGESRTGGTVGRDVSGPTTDDAMTRSEEELRVGKTERETGRARLRKYVVTDQVTETVPVKREEIRVEREPITDANVDRATEGPELSEEEHEVVLHEEEVVADKRVVPKERVRLDKDVEVDERTVSEDVRREEIDVDDAGTRTPRDNA